MYVRLYAVFAISLHLMQVNKAAYMYNILLSGWFAKFQNFKWQHIKCPKPKYMKTK